MNISLSKTASSSNNKGGNKVVVGLNRRGRDSVAISSTNVLDNNEDDDDEDDDINNDDDDVTGNHSSRSGRGTVNRELAAEQAALRKRAAAAAAAAIGETDSSIYDYDGVYDSFHQDKKSSQQSKETGGDGERKSRYVGDLLKAAQERQRLHDVLYERKLAKEQEAEGGGATAANQEERFITKAYKRKLQERQLWQEQEDARAREEEAKDVTKQAKGGAAWVNFYGNLSRNVALGGDDVKSNDDDDAAVRNRGENQSEKKTKTATSETDFDMPPPQQQNKCSDTDNRQEPSISSPANGGLTFLEGFERATTAGDSDSHDEGKTTRTRTTTARHGVSGGDPKHNAITTDATPLQDAEKSSSLSKHENSNTASSSTTLLVSSPSDIRKLREEKVAQARIRYFQRKGVVMENE